MLTEYGNLVCYKQAIIESDKKLKFFLEKRSTKEGTWGNLYIEDGEIDFVFLNGDGQELSRVNLNVNNPQAVSQDKCNLTLHKKGHC